jgi:glycosyltransferase involved in cell wall biosynthesis
MTFTIIICTYNNAGSLERVLAALAGQVTPVEVDWDVLVVENNCTDGTLEVVQAARERNPAFPLRMVSEPKQGLTPARHRGVRETTSEWLAFIDDDCLVADDWIQRAAETIARHPRCGGLGGTVRLSFQGEARPLPDDIGWVLARQVHADERSVASLAGAGMALRRKALEETGWLQAPLLEDRIGRRLVSGGDAEIAARIAHAGWELWFTPACRIEHLIPPERTTRPYLRRLARGLGVSQIMMDAITWQGGRTACFIAAARRAAGWLLHGVDRAARDLYRGRDPRRGDVLVSFAVGTLFGLVALVRRRSLIGAIVSGHRVGAPRNRTDT